jgi:hypothetical protein
MNNIFRKQTSRLFVIYCISGIAYIVLLALLSWKALPGFFMQVLFLTDSLIKNHSEVGSLLLSESFIQATVSGILSLVLVSIALKGILISAKQLLVSQRFLNSLKIKSKVNIITLEVTDTSIFTAGMFTPKVYISSKLKKSLSSEQLRAVLLHEFSHCKDFDPLRGFIVQLLNNILPTFPFKKNLIDIYFTSVELKSDEHSENILGKKRPIIEALYSILSNDFSISAKPNLAYFSNMPERIPVLVGAKKFNFNLVTSVSSLFLFVLISLPVFVYTINFYNCEHIEDCIQIFVNNIQSNSSENLCSMHSMDTPNTCTTN